MVTASEAGALADLLLEQVEGRALTGDVRGRLAARIKSLRLSNLSVFAGSLQKDPIHPSVYYIAVGNVVQAGGMMLLRIAPADRANVRTFVERVIQLLCLARRVRRRPSK